ncbi:MAG TPA: RraA family protein, partial [Actinoplanes sp.]|nr:RraA family protein [Actinoplanes sp.]
LCDAVADIRVMSPALRCRSANPMLCGPALTVRCRDDFLGVIQAIEQSAPGDVVVVDGGGRETALAGELFARVALTKDLAGIIIDGGYRDLRFIATCRLPVYSRHVSPRAGTTSRLAVLAETVSCGGVPVHPGDIVIADHDGIVVLDPGQAVAQLTAAAEVMATEARVVERLAAGAGLGDWFERDRARRPVGPRRTVEAAVHRLTTAARPSKDPQLSAHEIRAWFPAIPTTTVRSSRRLNTSATGGAC